MFPGCDVSQLWQFPLGDELVVARRDVHGLFLLNGTARFVWDEFNRGAAPGEIVGNFSTRYGMPEGLARHDVEATLAGWSQSLLCPARGNGGPRKCRSSVLRRLESNDATVEINCILNGRGFRVLIDSGDLVEEIAPRLAPAAVPHLPRDAPLVTFALADGEDHVFVFRDGVCIAVEEKTSGA